MAGENGRDDLAVYAFTGSLTRPAHAREPNANEEDGESGKRPEENHQE